MFSDLLNLVKDHAFFSKKYYSILVILIFAFFSILIGYIIKILFKFCKVFFKNINPFLHCFINQSNLNIIAFLISALIFRQLVFTVDIFFIHDINLKNLEKVIDISIIILSYQIIRKSIYNVNSYSKQNYNVIALNSFFEFSNVILFLFTTILSLSIIFDVSTYTILGTLGAVTAVIVLVFRDIILGFITGFQIYRNKVFQIGDWIELHSYNADGEIIEMNLISTKVLNWDKTITVIPTHALINVGIKNWDNISKLNIRRIKKHILVDLDSIVFFSSQEINEIKLNYSFENGISTKNITNLSLFRNHIIEYLKGHENISKDNIIMVRELQSNNFGLPLEIYCFTNTYVWNEYEDIHAEIIEYIIATLKCFKLKIFQSPRNTI